MKIMLYLQNYGEITIATIASQILNIKCFSGLETNHKCMNIIITRKCVYKLPTFSIKYIIVDYQYIYELAKQIIELLAWEFFHC